MRLLPVADPSISCATCSVNRVSKARRLLRGAATCLILLPWNPWRKKPSGVARTSCIVSLDRQLASQHLERVPGWTRRLATASLRNRIDGLELSGSFSYPVWVPEGGRQQVTRFGQIRFDTYCLLQVFNGLLGPAR